MQKEEPGEMEEGEDLMQLIKLLAGPRELRTSEDVFEIANGLFRASFIRQLDVTTRFARLLSYLRLYHTRTCTRNLQAVEYVECKILLLVVRSTWYSINDVVHSA